MASYLSEILNFISSIVSHPSGMGLLGIILGALINEWFRRSKRIEDFAIKLFEKRMLVYEGLFKQITKGYEIISPIFESNLSK